MRMILTGDLTVMHAYDFNCRFNGHACVILTGDLTVMHVYDFKRRFNGHACV